MGPHREKARGRRLEEMRSGFRSPLPVEPHRMCSIPPAVRGDICSDVTRTFIGGARVQRFY